MLALYIAMLETDEERGLFADFYEQHKGRCLQVALAITHNQAWAEDAVHNAFMRMIRHKDKYFTDPGKRTRTQIVIMVKSEALNLLKREKRLDHSLLDDVEPIVANDEPEAFRVASGKEAMAALQRHVSLLDETSRTLYQMKYISGRTDGEIADEVGITKNAVAIRIHKIRKSLLEKMRKEGYIDE